MSGAADAISLTKTLLGFDTINPPGRERDCARHAGAMLQEWGYKVEYHEYADARTSVIARAGGSDEKAPLCLTGHLDVVSLGTLSGTPGVVIVLTAAEEGGCMGSKKLAETQLLGKAGAIVVGEPTSNYPFVGHKGSLKFSASFRGVSAHGSMPHLGENAVYKAARAVAKLEEFDFKAKKHPIMGEPTLNVGTFEGGSGVNLVPDLAKIGVDIRTVPGVDHKQVIKRIKQLLGKAEIDVFSDLPPVWTAPDDEWMQRVFEICKPVLGKKARARTATYMTDAANLLKVYSGAPTVVLGPGEAQMAHQTDEYCNMARIGEAVAIYEALIDDWIR